MTMTTMVCVAAVVPAPQLRTENGRSGMMFGDELSTSYLGAFSSLKNLHPEVRPMRADTTATYRLKSLLLGIDSC